MGHSIHKSIFQLIPGQFELFNAFLLVLLEETTEISNDGGYKCRNDEAGDSLMRGCICVTIIYYLNEHRLASNEPGFQGDKS